MIKLFSRNTIAAALLATCAAMAQPANAAIIITSAGLGSAGYRTGTIAFTPSNFSESANVGAFKLTGYDSTTNAAVSYLSYCVDLFQPLGTGSFNLVALSDTGLNATKQSQLGALIANTAGLGTDADHSAAIQLAVWELLYEYQTTSAYSLSSGYFSATGGNLGNAKTIATTYLNDVTSGIWQADPSYTLSILSSSEKQDQLIYTRSTNNSVGQVPEPASWAMFIGGFGLTGAALRSRRRQTVAFA